jgi:Protein of unknown function (DUF1501)
MFSFQGSKRTLCDGLNRRELLRIGGLGAFGWGLNHQLLGQAIGQDQRVARETAALRGSIAVGDTGEHPQARTVGEAALSGSFGKAKACILIFLYGSPSQHETFDPKPNAPSEIQGEMKAIPTCVPGIAICERLPRTAKVVDRTTIVRSMSHPYPLHGVAYAVSGLPTYTPDLEARPRDVRHWPYIGSVVDYVHSKDRTKATNEMPRQMGLPWMLNSKADLLVNAGPFSGFLSSSHDPIWTDFVGEGTRLVPKYTDGQQQQFMDPFGGINDDGRFVLSQHASLPNDVSIERLGLRRSLLEQFNRGRRAVDSLVERQFHEKQGQAYSLLTSNKISKALDISLEPKGLREDYGMTLFGQSCLVARRLIESGVTFVSVFWDGFGQFANCAWDTHNNHFPRMKEYLLPGFDAAYPALIRDLDQRGMLDDTLVLCISEHGRTPQIDSKPQGAGRHHWSRAYSAIFAGGGISRGRVVGQTDSLGGDVVDLPVSPKDILATSFHLLGIDPKMMVPDMQSRPMPIAGDGQVRPEIIG